jgi:hypothetical protein
MNQPDNGKPVVKKIKIEPNQEETLEMKDGKPWNGKGEWTFPTCIIYRGVYKGNSYDGYWVNGKRHGKGKFTFEDGAIYTGEWENDERHGKGIYIYKNGDIYEGEWKDNKRHGKGIYKWKGGDFFEGEWRNDTKYNGRLYKLEHLLSEGNKFKPC